MEDAKNELIENDAVVDNAGPFFGLHLNVKELFVKHRCESYFAIIVDEALNC